jgi:hypothetical protein
MRTSIPVAALLAAAVSLGAADGRQEVPAQVLDRADFLCANCFFGPSDYYYCFAVDNKILIGYQKVPVLNWRDKSKNYLAKVRPAWAAWAAPGQTVPIGYDDKHIWVGRADSKPGSRSFWAHLKAVAMWVSHGEGKQVRLTQSSMRDIFTNHQCRAAGAPKAN